MRYRRPSWAPLYHIIWLLLLPILQSFSWADTALRDLAAKLQPGHWAELKTNGFDGGRLLVEGAAYIIQYTDEIIWDSSTKRLYFLGAGHGAGAGAGKFIRYEEATNTWTSLNSGVNYFRPFGGPSHSYNHQTVRPGKYYYRLYLSKQIHTYDEATDTWSKELPDLPDAPYTCCSALEYFPDIDSLIFVDSDWSGWRYDFASRRWGWIFATNGGPCSPGPCYKMSYENFARYNPVKHELLFGGGKNIYVLDAKGRVTIKRPAPVNIQNSGASGSGIVVADPLTGTYLVFGDKSDGVSGVFYEYNSTSDTWTLQDPSRNPPWFQNSVDGPIFGTAATAIPDYGVTLYVNFENPPNGKVWLYKHSSGSVTAGFPAAPVATPRLASAPPSPQLTPQDFAARCAMPGVILCNGFDSATDITGDYGDNKGTMPGASAPQVDGTIKASGSGSLKFTIPSNSPANSSGEFFTNFSKDLSVQFGENSEFYIQWRQRFSPEFLNTYYQGGGGWKQAIITTGDKPGCNSRATARGFCYPSCVATTIVIQNTNQRGFTQLYNSCTGSASHGPYTGFEETINKGADIKLQNARPNPYCLYSQQSTKPPSFFPPKGNCFGYFPNEWMTFQIHVKVGPRDGDEFKNSYVELWIAREGKPSEQVFNWGPYNLSAGPANENQRYGKIWLLPYHTGKDPNQIHPIGYTWYDELIVSRQKIPDPPASRSDQTSKDADTVNTR